LTDLLLLLRRGDRFGSKSGLCQKLLNWFDRDQVELAGIGELAVQFARRFFSTRGFAGRGITKTSPVCKGKRSEPAASELKGLLPLLFLSISVVSAAASERHANAKRPLPNRFESGS
jgi:hypothetical protein